MATTGLQPIETIDGPNVPASEWRSEYGREGLASINIAGREHVLSYPDQSNASEHINNILEGKVYPVVDEIPYAATTVIDVGANVGAAAAYFRSKYPTCTIYCYEPDADNFRYLKRNLSGLGNVYLRPVALFSRRQETLLFRGKSQCLQHSIYPSAEVTTNGEQIEMRAALDEVTPAITDNTVLKIDTEGCEYPILSSLQPVLNKISIIYLEFHSERDRQRIDELLSATHGLWSAKITDPHRGDLCYVHRKLYEHNDEVQKWEIKCELEPSAPA